MPKKPKPLAVCRHRRRRNHRNLCDECEKRARKIEAKNRKKNTVCGCSLRHGAKGRCWKCYNELRKEEVA